MAKACCLEGLVALIAPSSRGRDVMLPAPSYVQTSSRFALSHRSHTRLLKTYDLSDSTALGEGSFGTVVKTKSRVTGSACVMKKINKGGMPAEVLECLANEIAVHAVCDHPNIVRIYESFEVGRHIHIALEACEGGEVQTLLTEQGSLCEAGAKLVMRQVLQAVLYLHGVKSVAHRDLKLENLLLKKRGVPLEDNTVKVIDFGFAASFVPGERSFSGPCGTPVYMAPEVLTGAYDEKCDIWSSGVMLYELLSGDLPFDAPTVQGILRMAATRSLPFAGAVWGGVSEAAKALIRSMCDKHPSRRASAEEALQSPCFGGPEAVSRRTSVASLRSERSISSESIVDNLRSFSSMSGFQKAALRVAAYRLDDEHISMQRSAFKLLDRNGDGRLTLEELSEGCPEIGLSAAEAKELFQRLDVDGSGHLEYSEFIGAAVSKDSLPHHACWEAFSFCDRDGSGSISAKEARELLYSHAPSEKACGEHEEEEEEEEEEKEMDFHSFSAMLRGDGGRLAGS